MRRRPLLALPAAALAAGLLGLPAFADHHEKGERADAPDLRGFYKLTGGEKYGETIPAARLKDNRATITKERFAVVDKDQADLYASSYKVVGPAKVKGEDGTMMEGCYEIDLVSEIPEKGSKAPALLKVVMGEEDGKKVVKRLHLIYSLDGKRPENFKTADKQLAFVMERTAAPADVDGDAGDEDGEEG